MIGRLVPKEPPRGFTRKPPGDPIGRFIAFPTVPDGPSANPSVHVDNLMRKAKQLERSNLTGALAVYVHVVWRYPDLPQAKTARKRLTEIGVKEREDGSLLFER